jgi:hypothetical protein
LIEKAASTNDTRTPATIAASEAENRRPGDGCHERRRECTGEQLALDGNIDDADPLRDHATERAEDEGYCEAERTEEQAGHGNSFIRRRPGQEPDEHKHTEDRDEPDRHLLVVLDSPRGEGGDESRSTETTIPVIRVGRPTSGNWMRSAVVDRRIVLTPSRANTTRSRNPSTVNTARAIGAFQLRMTAAGAPEAGSTGWVGWVTGAAMLTSQPPPW